MPLYFASRPTRIHRRLSSVPVQNNRAAIVENRYGYQKLQPGTKLDGPKLAHFIAFVRRAPRHESRRNRLARSRMEMRGFAMSHASSRCCPGCG